MKNGCQPAQQKRSAQAHLLDVVPEPFVQLTQVEEGLSIL
jgi:hypothetical protein